MSPAPSFSHLLLLVLGLLLAASSAARGQSDAYDASWYDPDAPHVRLAVAEDGVYRVTAADVAPVLPSGTTLSRIDPASLRLIENGTEIPISVSGAADGSFDADDAITFVGRRNRGDDETWAYDSIASNQNSTYRSLFADTTYYWLTWGGNTGRRYAEATSGAPETPTTSLRDRARREEDNRYYYGRSFESGDPLYTEGEGYYWRRFTHNTTGTLQDVYTVPTRRRTTEGTARVQVRLETETSSCHRVRLEAELLRNGTPTFVPLETTEWRGFDRRDLTGSIPQDEMPTGDLRLRLTSFNTTFNDGSCPNPSTTPNYVLLDWVEVEYTRSLDADGDRQTFTAPSTSRTTFSMTGFSSSTVEVYSPSEARRFRVSTSGGAATFTDTPSSSTATYWAAGSNSVRRPDRVLPDTPSRLAQVDEQGAEYVILTTSALRPSAERLADYRRTESGYDVSIALIQDVYDEFDYGRPTPIALRRFVRTLQSWTPEPQFLAIFGDAPFPADGLPAVRAPWSILSFGFGSSDGWFAMQNDGRGDWTESIAIGRIPVRSVAHGDLFLEKLQTYESAESAAWQKRMLLLAGGTSEAEQNSLQFYSNNWGELATGTSDSLFAAGMDTLRYYKQVDDALDTRFADSLAVDLKRGTGWLNYFGHSAAQTWEIVTDPPAEFDNAGRLPIVVSLGCKTGTFAGDRFGVRSVPSLGEQLVVGRVDDDGTPRPGSENGGIAHWGTSELGNRLPSAFLNDGLIERVFRDTVRVLGTAIVGAKEDVARDFGNSTLYARHLRQYGLIGDPATRINLPTRPDLKVAANDVRIRPQAPTPSESITVDVALQNYGLVPSDSVHVDLTWTRPDGSTQQEVRRLPRFALTSTSQFSFQLDNRAVGSNAFQIVADPDDQYDELRETNNRADVSKVVFDSGLELIAPAPSGVAATTSPRLRVGLFQQDIDAEAPVEIQVDTTPSFDSSSLQAATLTGDGLVVDWTPPEPLRDATTYYWRARFSNADASSWKTGAFTVAANLPDAQWAQQSRLFQDNTLDQLTRQNESWAFTTFGVSVASVSDRGRGDDGLHGFVVNSTNRYLRLQLGFGVLIMDGTSSLVKEAQSFATYDLPTQFEDLQPSGEGNEAIDSLAAMLDRADPGDYVFVRTRHLGRESGPEIPERVKTLFRQLGTTPVPTPHTTSVDTLTYNHMWAMKARKGDPSATEERISPPSETDVRSFVLESNLAFSNQSGTVTSTTVGPAQDWTALQWTATTEAADDVQLSVLSLEGDVLVDDVRGASGRQPLDAIDASVHPYLQLRAVLADSVNRTAPQLDRWSVDYAPVPELAIDPSSLAALSDSVTTGAPLAVDIRTRHLAGPPASNVRLAFSVTDADNRTEELLVDSLGTLALDEDGSAQTSVSTTDRPGRNLVRVDVRHDTAPERIAYNNTGLHSFFVRSDDVPPSLRVLVEGRELSPTPDILNDLQSPRLPFVSAQPTLEITVRDDNPNLPLTDTSYVSVFLKEGLPERGASGAVFSEFRRIPFSGGQLEFQPPGDDAEARVLFSPTLDARDATYTLKVEAQDVQGNEIEPYQVSFRVQQEQVIEDLYPYPNPMSTQTRFAFRVRGGSTPPSDFRLRIYTVSGRLVREFDGADVNDGRGLRASGWNFLTWNGTDADGDRVATGVYLYRVRMEGENGTFEGDVEKVSVIR